MEFRLWPLHKIHFSAPNVLCVCHTTCAICRRDTLTLTIDFHLLSALNWSSKYYKMEITTDDLYIKMNFYSIQKFYYNSNLFLSLFPFFSLPCFSHRPGQRERGSHQFSLAFLSHARINMRRSKIFVYLKNSFNRKTFISRKRRKFNNAKNGILESIVLSLLLSWSYIFCNI